METRYGTYFDVAENFIYVPTDFECIFNEQSRTSGQESFKILSKYINDTDGSTKFPALEAIITCLKPIGKMKKCMESTRTPILHQLLPQLERLKTTLTFISSGVCSNFNSNPDNITSSLAKQSLEELSNIRIHGLSRVFYILYYDPYAFFKSELT